MSFVDPASDWFSASFPVIVYVIIFSKNVNLENVKYNCISDMECICCYQPGIQIRIPQIVIVDNVFPCMLWIECTNFHTWKCVWKYHLQSGGHLFMPEGLSSVNVTMIYENHKLPEKGSPAWAAVRLGVLTAVCSIVYLCAEVLRTLLPLSYSSDNNCGGHVVWPAD